MQGIISGKMTKGVQLQFQPANIGVADKKSSTPPIMSSMLSPNRGSGSSVGFDASSPRYASCLHLENIVVLPLIVYI